MSTAGVETAAVSSQPPLPSAETTATSSTTTTTTTTTPHTNVSSEQPVGIGAVIPKSEQHESDELTKRLQKLALERQKESKGERLKVIQNDSSQQHLTSAKTFQELNLPAHLLDAIFAMGFDRPSAIQEEALPRILADPPRNLIGQAQSGSGKVRTQHTLAGWVLFVNLTLSFSYSVRNLKNG
jgi:hypothetical protein